VNNLKIKNVIFCENVRAELSGKYTLLGASAPELTVLNSAIPATISGAVFVTGIPQQSGQFSVEIRITDPDKIKILDGKLEGNFSGAGMTSLAVGPVPVTINKGGLYTFEWSFDGKKWTTLETVNILIAPAEITAVTQ
jgi:hypothetical protein